MNMKHKHVDLLTHTLFILPPFFHLFLFLFLYHFFFFFSSQLGLNKISKAQRESINKAKVLDPFYKLKKSKAKQRGDFHSNINSSAGEFPMSAAIKACQIRCDTGGRREKYSNHLSNLFPALPL